MCSRIDLLDTPQSITTNYDWMITTYLCQYNGFYLISTDRWVKNISSRLSTSSHRHLSPAPPRDQSGCARTGPAPIPRAPITWQITHPRIVTNLATFHLYPWLNFPLFDMLHLPADYRLLRCVRESGVEPQRATFLGILVSSHAWFGKLPLPTLVVF